jgi:hypothetical protein
MTRAFSSPRPANDWALISAAPEVLHPQGHLGVAQESQVLVREEAAGAAGMAEDEDRLALGRAGGAPRQVVLGAKGLALVVDAEEAAIEVEAGELEVVSVAAEEGGLLLGEDQPHVGVGAIAVEVVLPALEEGDDLALEVRWPAWTRPRSRRWRDAGPRPRRPGRALGRPSRRRR